MNEPRDRGQERPGAEADSAQTQPRVFFVVGHAKSGTSWLMRLLNAHPEIMCRGEGRIFGRSFRRADLKDDHSSPFQPCSLYRAFLESDYLRLWLQRSVWTREVDVERSIRRLTRVAARHFMIEQLEGTRKSIVGDKTPFLSAETLSEIADIYPDAKVVHIIRDGRDVAVSGMHHLWNRELDLGGGNDLTPQEAMIRDAFRADPRGVPARGGIFTPRRLCLMAESWREMVARARDDGPNLLGDRYAEVRYEDLRTQPAVEARRILRFLNADSRPEIARRCAAASSFVRWTGGRRPGQEDSTSLLRKGVTGDWRRVFTARDRKLFDRGAGELLIELGYEPDRRWAGGLGSQAGETLGVDVATGSKAPGGGVPPRALVRPNAVTSVGHATDAG
jgi:sulfotransferase family protein